MDSCSYLSISMFFDIYSWGVTKLGDRICQYFKPLLFCVAVKADGSSVPLPTS